MIVKTTTQPDTQLGIEISDLLDSRTVYTRIVFVSAFVALRTVLRLREKLLELVEAGTRLCLTVGIDLGGTSKEVLEELLRWNCQTFIFHNAIARATFHPKIYLFQSAESATLFIGSNNLTDGGFYTNYEAATRYDFVFPADAFEYERIVSPLHSFLEPNGKTVQPLDIELIQTLVARGELPSEAEARERNRKQRQNIIPTTGVIPDNPFKPVAIPFPPLLPRNVRAEEPTATQATQHIEDAASTDTLPPPGVLVWMKTLSKSDALQVRAGSHPVGGVRLVQADFENPIGHRIDQTTYFRSLFTDYQWENELRGHKDQEHTFVPMRIFIRGKDFGIRNFDRGVSENVLTSFRSFICERRERSFKERKTGIHLPSMVTPLV